MYLKAIEPFIVALLWVYPVFAIYKRVAISQGKVLFTMRKRVKWIVIDALFSLISLFCAVFFFNTFISAIQKNIPYTLSSWLLLTGCVFFFGYFTVILTPFKNKFTVTEQGILSPSLSALRAKIISYQWFETQEKDSYILMFTVRCLGLMNFPMPLVGFNLNSQARKNIDAALAVLKLKKTDAAS